MRESNEEIVDMLMARDQDFELQNHGTVWLLQPTTARAKAWLNDHVIISDETQRFGGAVVIEHRYVDDVADGILRAGLSVKYLRGPRLH